MNMLFLRIDKEHKRSYARQIYIQLRQKILNGELNSGEILPSTRELSNELHVSRNTVLTAYDMLVSEGFAFSLPGSGIYVKQGVNIFQSQEKVRDYQMASLSFDQVPPNTISFDSGIPALDLFPRNKWNRVTAQAFKEAPFSVLGYDDPQGRPEFRSVLAAYLKKTRGVNCHPDQIIITSGAKQGLSLIAKCLLNHDSEVWLEDPSNDNVKRIFSYHTNKITPIAVDNEGIQLDCFPINKKPTFIFVTPSHQFPMGGVLSIQRRLELIRFARQTGCYLVEDDYDSEFRYDGIPINSLYELDREHVIYIGTFSKVLFPSLRLGYLVLPFPIVEQCREWKRLGDHHSNSIYQLALMRFIESGELEKHIMRMKKLYYKRRNSLLELVNRHFPNQVNVYGEATGMHIVAEFDGVIFSPELIRCAKTLGIYIVPVENHAITKDIHINKIILGYAHLDPLDIDQGLIRLKKVLSNIPLECY